MQQRPNGVAVLEDGPPQAGRRGEIQRALQRARGALVLGEGIEAIASSSHASARVDTGPRRGPRAVGVSRCGASASRAATGSPSSRRSRAWRWPPPTEVAVSRFGTLEQRVAGFGLADGGAQQRLLGEQLVVQRGEQGPVADVVAGGLQDAERRLRVAAVAQQERAIEGMHRAQRAIARGVQRLRRRSPRSAAHRHGGRAGWPPPPGRSRRRRPAPIVPSRGARRGPRRRRHGAAPARLAAKGPSHGQVAPRRGRSSPSRPRRRTRGRARGGRSRPRGRRSTARRYRAA